LKSGFLNQIESAATKHVAAEVFCGGQLRCTRPT
jgi:hypothetical protein